MQLRDYQSQTVQATFSEWESHDSTLVVLPTGMGKTVVFATIAARWTEGRVLVIAPQIELVDQAAKKIQQVTGEWPAIEQASRRSNESAWARQQFIVGCRASLLTTVREKRKPDRYGVMQTHAKHKRYERLSDVGLVIVDEAHLGLTEPFKELLDHYKSQGAKVLGVTATPKRHDNKALGMLYDSCAINIGIADAIEAGWLVPPTTHCLQLKSLDLSEVKTSRGGDFKSEELAKALEDEQVVYEIAELTAAESQGLKTAVYCESVAQARQVAHLLADQHGMRAEYVSGECRKEKRKDVLASFANDVSGVQVVCNCGVLTTGWDFPGLEHIVVARPTKSLPLYTQIIGRGTRPLEGIVDFEGSTPETRRAAIASSAKPTFKVTDLRDNSLQHKLVTAVDVLGGDMELAVRERAEEILRNTDNARPLGEVLAEAREAQEEFERKERERLARLRAKASYAKQSVDPFDESQRGAGERPSQNVQKIKFGKYKGMPLAEVPGHYLKYMANNVPNMPGWMRSQVFGELARRKASNKAATPTVSTGNGDTLSKLQQLLAEV